MRFKQNYPMYRDKRCTFQQVNQDFPQQYKSNKNKAGKILSKYSKIEHNKQINNNHQSPKIHKDIDKQQLLLSQIYQNTNQQSKQIKRLIEKQKQYNSENQVIISHQQNNKSINIGNQEQLQEKEGINKEINKDRQIQIPIIEQSSDDFEGNNNSVFGETNGTNSKQMLSKLTQQFLQFDQHLINTSPQSRSLINSKIQHQFQIIVSVPQQLHQIAKDQQKLLQLEQNPQNQLHGFLQTRIKTNTKQSEQLGNQQFDIEAYSQVYLTLKQIQLGLKNHQDNHSTTIRSIRKYLSFIARGNLDSIDAFHIQPQKKKIIKTALLYQRVIIIIVAFQYANHSLNQSLKLMQNNLAYVLSSCLMIIQILQNTQINASTMQQKNQNSQKFTLRKNLQIIKNNNECLFQTIVKLAKHVNLFYQNLKKIIKTFHQSSLEETFYNVLEYLSFFLCVSEMHQILPFLAVAPDPYLPMIHTHPYTLVVDIVDVSCLNARIQKTTTHIRPFTEHFLKQMNKYFQIIIFTNYLPNQVDKFIDNIDPHHLVKHRLYRHHCINIESKWVKDIERIGRDPQKMILLDNQNIGGSKNKDYCINIPIWKGNKNNTTLAELCSVLAIISIRFISVKNYLGQLKY